MHFAIKCMLFKTFTFGLVKSSNGLCPRLHISYMSTPKLHTSLAVEYFLKKIAYRYEIYIKIAKRIINTVDPHLSERL